MKAIDRRTFLKVAGVGAGAVALTAGCQRAGLLTPTAKPVVPTKAPPKATLAPSGKPVWSPPDLSGKTFSIWGLQFDPHVETYHRLAAKFEEYTGAKATVEPQG